MNNMVNERFPSSFEEGWIRPQFSLVALSAGGDGVVKANSGYLFFYHLPQIHELNKYVKISTDSHGFGYSSCPGGEIFDSLNMNKLHR
jgi:hypothetical protein